MTESRSSDRKLKPLPPDPARHQDSAIAPSRNNVAIISGAGTVPGLTSAVIEHLRPQFSEIDALEFGIAPGQKAERGLATTQAILGYVGKKLKRCAGYETRYGWQDLHLQKYPDIGSRLMANCDIPDLDLLPEKYGIRKIRFSAGMENPVVHLGIWTLSWVVRAGFPIDLSKHSAALLALSNRFDFLGSADGGNACNCGGQGQSGQSNYKGMVCHRSRRRRALYSDHTGGRVD
jgi:hypothetical protein